MVRRRDRGALTRPHFAPGPCSLACLLIQSHFFLYRLPVCQHLQQPACVSFSREFSPTSLQFACRLQVHWLVSRKPAARSGQGLVQVREPGYKHCTELGLADFSGICEARKCVSESTHSDEAVERVLSLAMGWTPAEKSSPIIC